MRFSPELTIAKESNCASPGSNSRRENQDAAARAWGKLLYRGAILTGLARAPKALRTHAEHRLLNVERSPKPVSNAIVETGNDIVRSFIAARRSRSASKN
jgi:hypothetical protein